jgi:NAD-dependent dihydropyrimidine dehydrogenase PreA subunit
VKRKTENAALLSRRALLGGGGLDESESQHARVTEGCLARRGIVCQSCRDACPESAIRFRPRLGRVAEPEVDLAACTGCGECVTPCPVAAIDIAAGRASPRVG